MTKLRTLAADVAAGRVAAAEALAASARRIDEADDRIMAFAARPESLEPGEGPLAGIACGVKDIIDTAALPTGMGSPIYEGWRPRADASVVTALAAAGATLAGKTRTTAFAFLDPAPTRNPHDPQASPGGSSAGSAAAVAAGMVPLAIGTQTGGSVIRPAAYCGVASIKPSFGLVPSVGVKVFSWSLDTVGLMAEQADDLAFALAAILGRPELDAGAAGLAGLRLGLHRQPYAGPPEPGAEEALLRAAGAAATAGATLVEPEAPAAFAEAFAAHGPLQDYEATRALAWEYAAHRDSLPPKLGAYLEAARAVGPDRYDAARRQARAGRAAARRFFGEVDAILTYAAPGEAPATRDSTGDSRFNRLWTLLGVPCVGIPVTRGPRGLPVGVQIVAAFGRDGEALSIAAALEKALATAA